MGHLSRNDGALTKKEAYRKLKKRLNLSNKAMIFKEVFNIFYYKTGDLYIPCMNERDIDAFFESQKLTELNQRIFNVKKRFPYIGTSMYQKAITGLRVEIKNFVSPISS